MPYDVFTPGNNYRFNGQIGYYRYTYFYYGDGNNFENYGGELYSFTFARLQLNALKRFNKHTFFGLRYWMEDFTVTDVEEEGLLAEGNVPGAIGGLVSGIGPSLQIDSRDKIFFPREGQFIEASIIFNAPTLGSDFSFTKLTFNGSQYFSISPKSVLAVNAYLEFNLGETPFSQMALLGGRRLRGYYEGRYRDKNVIVGQGEWRFPIWRRFKGTIFGGVGVVAERADVFSAKYLRPAVGAGLRYLALKEQQIHVRFDLAWGQNSSGFYLTIGEAF
jgi:outer membrane protein assembly factor BamA